MVQDLPRGTTDVSCSKTTNPLDFWTHLLRNRSETEKQKVNTFYSGQIANNKCVNEEDMSKASDLLPLSHVYLFGSIDLSKWRQTEGGPCFVTQNVCRKKDWQSFSKNNEKTSLELSIMTHTLNVQKYSHFICLNKLHITFQFKGIRLCQ